METKGFFPFEINLNVLVSSFWIIWIPMSWVYQGSHTSWKTLKNYGCPGMSWKSPGKTQFFRLSWNSGILIKMSWKRPWVPSMEFGFLWQSFSDQLAIFLHVLCIIQVLKKLEFWKAPEIFDETDGPIRNHQFSTYFCLRGPPFKYQRGRGLEFFWNKYFQITFLWYSV